MTNLVNEWHSASLTHLDILEWLEKSIEFYRIVVRKREDKSWFANQILKVYRWYHQIVNGYEAELEDLFLQAIITNNLLKATSRADRRQNQYLHLFALYFYNQTPMRVYKIAKETFGCHLCQLAEATPLF